ncbi:MAG: dihydroorotate dehydrogenase electron transfer subunit, partial [Thermoplasmata archaeon]
MQGPRMFTVKEHLQETPSIMTIRFKEGLDALPGQFVMVWVPGVDEFPMSVSYCGRHFGITYQIVGDGTKALAAKKVGEKVGVRGPYGNGFAVDGKRLLLVAGGSGMASMAPLVEHAVGKRASVDLVLGARTSKEILFERRCTRKGAKVHVSTDDGSKGFEGLATDLAREILA